MATLTAMESQAAHPAAGAAAPNNRQTDAARQHIMGVLSATKQLAWKKTHMPLDQQQRQALSGTQEIHRTTAPITHCLAAVQPGTQQPLHFLLARHPAHTKRKHLIRRIRLLHGRARTAAVATASHTTAVNQGHGAAATANALCPHPQCAARDQTETISHLLLECPYYNGAARNTLHSTLQGCGLLSNDIASILNPPIANKLDHRRLFQASTKFIQHIYKTRQELGLPDLDSGVPYVGAPVPPPLPPQPSAPSSPHIPPPLSGASGAPLAAVGAPPSLDTG